MRGRAGDDQPVDGDGARHHVARLFEQRQERHVQRAFPNAVHEVGRGAVAELDLDGGVERVEFTQQQRQVDEGIEAGAGAELQLALLQSVDGGDVRFSVL